MLPDRITGKIDKAGPGGFWLWTACLNPNGYGQVRVAGKAWLAHRRVYTLLVGEIPEGLSLDHTCRVHRCVNPEHLEPVTHAESL